INASDSESGVASVQLCIDGNVMGQPDVTAPYVVSFDTTDLANGAHTLTANATDVLGNVGHSAPVSVTFNNAGAGDPAQVGFWNGLVSLPSVPVHVALMSNQKIL